MNRSIDDVLREASDYFAERGRGFDTLRRITRRLDKERIDYALIGAMALFVHGFRRFTNDVDTVISRLKDLGDVVELIKVLKLPRDLGEQLDPSVRSEYFRLWDGAQNVWDPSDG